MRYYYNLLKFCIPSEIMTYWLLCLVQFILFLCVCVCVYCLYCARDRSLCHSIFRFVFFPRLFLLLISCTLHTSDFILVGLLNAIERTVLVQQQPTKWTNRKKQHRTFYSFYFMCQWVGVCIMCFELTVSMYMYVCVCFMFRFNIHLLIFRCHAFGGTIFRYTQCASYSILLLLLVCRSFFFFSLFILCKYLPIVEYTIEKKDNKQEFVISISGSMLCVFFFLYFVLHRGTWSQSQSYHTPFYSFDDTSLHTIASMFKICVIFFHRKCFFVMTNTKYCKNGFFFHHQASALWHMCVFAFVSEE